MAKNKRKLNRPTRAKCHAISEWLKANKDKLLADRPTIDATAALATEALEFVVSPSTLATELKLLDLKWTPKRGEGGRINTHEIARSCAVFCRVVAEKLNLELPLKLQQFLAQEAERKRQYQKKKEDAS